MDNSKPFTSLVQAFLCQFLLCVCLSRKYSAPGTSKVAAFTKFHRLTFHIIATVSFSQLITYKGEKCSLASEAPSSRSYSSAQINPLPVHLANTNNISVSCSIYTSQSVELIIMIDYRMSADDLCSSLVPWFRNRPDDVLNEIARQSNIERADMRRPNIVQDATLRRPVRQAAQRLIRWSTALPEEVFQIGFQPRVFPDTDEFPGGAFNLRSYVGQNIDSIFVSTTQPYINDAGDTYSWRRRAGGNIWHRYEYEIYAYGGIDVNRALGDHLNSRQHEIAFAGGILPAMIRSAREYTGGPVIRIWINTNFDNTLNPPGENPPLAELPDERCTPRDAEIHYIPGPDNAAPPPHQPHGHDEHKRRRRSADNDDLMFPGANGGGVQDPLYNITPVPLSAVACVRDPTNSNRAYFFCANRYSVININPGTTYDTIAWGPKSIADSWPSLWQAGFSGGVDAVLPNPRNNKEMYFFCKTRYALINIALGV